MVIFRDIVKFAGLAILVFRSCASKHLLIYTVYYLITVMGKSEKWEQIDVFLARLVRHELEIYMNQF